LVLGPLLRYVDETSATIWVETDAPCSVRVLDAEASTFTVHGHHYALVDITGLTPGSSTPYEVHLDDGRAWPAPDSDFPASRIRTMDPSRGLRLVFGSCRTSVPHDPENNRVHGVDVLRGYGSRLVDAPEHEWADAVLFLGDQVYADEPSEEMKEFAAARRDITVSPGEELADYEEYTQLYRLAWSEPLIRWLLSTLPSMMIFDDHDIRDDWNTSDVWRAQMAELPWWQSRIVGGLGSYWIYQHLGNMPIEERRTDSVLQELLGHDGDGADIVDTFAAEADAAPERNRWSYTRDFGRNRLVVLDSRCGRVLTPGERTLLDETEWAWFDDIARGDVDHLLIGTSLPYLLPRGLHEMEAWNEAVADGRWGKRAAGAAEKVRQLVDLEHWGAFHDSFDKMVTILDEISSGQRGAPPASIVFLSGDVHYSYLMRARTRRKTQDTPIFQAVCSPIRNPLSTTMRYVNTAASFGLAGVLGRVLARSAGLKERALTWRLEHGPVFSNALATIELDGRAADLRWETATQGKGDEEPELEDVTAIALTGPRAGR
jgi:hypothetical protein